MTTGVKNSPPSELVRHVTAGCGQPGVEWLARLPETLAGLEQLWSVSILDPFPHIEFNFVAPALDPAGRSVVVKVAPPWEPVEIFCEAAYLRDRDGAGCVRLLDVSAPHRALLLERVLPGVSSAAHFAGRESELLQPAIAALKRVLRPPAAEGADVMSLDAWFDGLQKYKTTGFPAKYAENALRIYASLRDQPNRSFYLHGDFHPGNLVTAAGGDLTVIDPKGVNGHIGYEIAVFMNNYHWWQAGRPDIRQILAAALERWADAFEITLRELRQWAYAQMVIGAWWNYKDMPSLYDGEVAKADVWDV